uniref:hypothetical protein n=1 Tax=Nonomuraea pusilla TaxID=46177 RepID=UPI0006E20FFE|nr:hypothetical protein [Nonomuraea pusilla]
MRHPSATVALLAAAVIGGAGLAPAAAHARSAHSTDSTHSARSAHLRSATPQARAAWVRSCAGEDDSTRPCGHWRLILRDGGAKVVRDAAIGRIDRKGNEIHDTAAFAISADGRVIAYERAGDHRLVVRGTAGGPARVLPAALTAKGTDPLTLRLSPTGDRLLVDYDDAPGRRHDLVVTLATGATAKLPAAEQPLGFSGDGGEVISTRYTADNTTVVYAHTLGGATVRRTPPQAVAGAVALALNPDGHTVAVFTPGDDSPRRPPRVRVYDLESGELTAGADLPLKAEEAPYTARWAADGTLTAVVQTGEDGDRAVVRELTVDPETGATRQTDRYTISGTRYANVVAGE